MVWRLVRSPEEGWSRCQELDAPRVDGTATYERVSYPNDRLVVIYVRPSRGVERAFVVLTRSPRYRTVDGVGVGSPRAAVDHARGFSGRGYERPVVGLSGPGARVALVMLAARAD